MESRLAKIIFTVSLLLMGTANAQFQQCYRCDAATIDGDPGEGTEACLREQNSTSFKRSCSTENCLSISYTAGNVQSFTRACGVPGTQSGCIEDTAEIERQIQETFNLNSLPVRVGAGRACHCSGELCNSMLFEFSNNAAWMRPDILLLTYMIFTFILHAF